MSIPAPGPLSVSPASIVEQGNNNFPLSHVPHPASAEAHGVRYEAASALAFIESLPVSGPLSVSPASIVEQGNKNFLLSHIPHPASAEAHGVRYETPCCSRTWLSPSLIDNSLDWMPCIVCNVNNSSDLVDTVPDANSLYIADEVMDADVTIRAHPTRRSCQIDELAIYRVHTRGADPDYTTVDHIATDSRARSLLTAREYDIFSFHVNSVIDQVLTDADIPVFCRTTGLDVHIDYRGSEIHGVLLTTIGVTALGTRISTVRVGCNASTSLLLFVDEFLHGFFLFAVSIIADNAVANLVADALVAESLLAASLLAASSLAESLLVDHAVANTVANTLLVSDSVVPSPMSIPVSGPLSVSSASIFEQGNKTFSLSNVPYPASAEVPGVRYAAPCCSGAWMSPSLIDHLQFQYTVLAWITPSRSKLS